MFLGFSHSYRNGSKGLGPLNFRGFKNFHYKIVKSQVRISELALKYVPNRLIISTEPSSGVVAVLGYLTHFLKSDRTCRSIPVAAGRGRGIAAPRLGNSRAQTLNPKPSAGAVPGGDRSRVANGCQRRLVCLPRFCHRQRWRASLVDSGHVWGQVSVFVWGQSCVGWETYPCRMRHSPV